MSALLVGAMARGESAARIPTSLPTASPQGSKAPPQGTANASAVTRPYPWKNFPSFPVQLESTLPRDVDNGLYNQLHGAPGQPDFAHLNRLFDIFSWQTFISLNWPVDAEGTFLPSIDSPGMRWYLTWKSTAEVFKKDGSKPSPWRARPDSDHLRMIDDNLPFRVLDATRQASSTLPLVDQNGNLVYYDVVINKTLFDRIDKCGLYNLDGQIAYFQKYKMTGLALPWGSEETENSDGSIAVKLAWKILGDDDIEERFIRRKACIKDPRKPAAECEERLVGLVGVNIARKVFKAKDQWVWAAFEHVDNLQVNDLETYKGKQLKPLFNDPKCPTCPLNHGHDLRNSTLKKTQVVRVMPIPEATRELNSGIQALLKEKGSELQFYELVGTQWPTTPTVSPTDPATLPGGLANTSGGMPNMAFLANSVIETYLQGGNEPVSFLEAGNPGDNRIVFSASSCMGCHFKAPIAAAAIDGLVWNTTGAVREQQHIPAWGAPQSGDFLWIFHQASWNQVGSGGTQVPAECK